MKNFIYTFLLLPLFLVSQTNTKGIPSRDIAFKTFTINPNSCNGFQCTSGSLIYVPNNAFTLEDGNACDGTIIIKYREFHSQTDMFYARINMLFADGKVYRILESAGMFEIQAWCGTKKLILQEGKQIQVRMKTRRNVAGLMSFIYDAEKNTWSKYPSKVYDFSYFENNNKADSVGIWGSAKVRRPSAALLDGDGEVFKPLDYTKKLPEGFFKGINIGKLGLFNYDGVIKEELAVPMTPEFFVKQDGSPIQQKVYVVYQGRNSMVYYYPSDFAENFVLLKLKGTRIFTEFTDGSIAILKAGELDKLDLESYRKKGIKITLEKQPLKPKTEKELSEATGLSMN